MAVLTFNLVSCLKDPDGSETSGDWKIVHSHSSFVKPELKPEGQ